MSPGVAARTRPGFATTPVSKRRDGHRRPGRPGWRGKPGYDSQPGEGSIFSLPAAVGQVIARDAGPDVDAALRRWVAP
jgi:hypothetical protein